jgi:PEP-CTERM motif
VGATSGFTNNGLLNIGSTSTLTVGGGNNLIQTSTGIHSLQIGGSSPGGYSQLVATSSANLDGTLNLSLINGFMPYNGEQFVILTSSDLSGDFSTVNGPQDGNVTFTVAYSPPGYANDVVLDASVSSSVVPEPASWLMLGLGLTAVETCVVRKSKSQVRGK